MISLRPILFALTLSPMVAGAVTLDWNNHNWSSGSLSQSFNVDGSGGDDVQITFSGATNRLNDGSGGYEESPNDTTAYTGGFGNTQESVRLGINFNAGESLTTTIRFLNTGGVRNVSFYIFDVDFNASQYQDRLGSFQAYRNGALVASYATLTGGTYVSVANSGTASATATGITADSTANQSLGNLLVSFNAAVTIDEIRFNYSNLVNPPGQQAIALYDINYTPVPEASTALSALLLVGALFGHRFGRKRGLRDLVTA